MRINNNKYSIGIDLVTDNYGDVRHMEYAYAILPWGATEPHNYHLPYFTDCLIAYHIALDSAQKTWDKYGIRGMVLPPIPLGSQNPGQTNQPFCLHGRYETQRAILTDIVESLLRQGLKKLLIINGHGGNNFKNMIRDLNLDHPDMLVASCEWFRVESQKDYFELPDDHAGEMETSVMLHYCPDIVKMEQAGEGKANKFNIEAFNAGIIWVPRNWEKVTSDTGVGDPRRATAEKGKRFAEVVTDKIADFLHDLNTKDIYKNV